MIRMSADECGVRCARRTNLRALTGAALRLLHRDISVKGSLLGIGAGDGNVTKSLDTLADKVTTTEVLAPMAKSLNAGDFNHRPASLDKLPPWP
jgi:hypothetical protein